jgi:hypothetical protein
MKSIHSREFLAEELIPDESEVEGSPKRKLSAKLQKLKPGAVEIISLVRPDEAQQQVTLPAPKSGAAPLDVRISSEVATDLFPKKKSQELGVARSEDTQVVIQLRHSSAANEPVSTVPDRTSRAPIALNFTRREPNAYVAYCSEGTAEETRRAKTQ